ncbi:sigma-70 family RNA polymerase sigma factor [Haloimpatiens lingqiaonensis]|uniref:sigma-70 family RNA polymerase sigma factor n=1 Tax=Haloimpatiens lingqiaonensis TaxID=1380675 RepID=UPI0010FDBF37|nr:sigma-70 family RNA polymerase sigma factor [Haloimpatiens lingqiaonensis]
MELDFLRKENRDKFIKDSMNFIYKTTNRICKKNLDDKNDDEISIALIAFNKACDTYNYKKGSFFNYASIIIKNSLIDFFKKSNKASHLIWNDEDTFNSIDNTISINNFNIASENYIRMEEIKLLNDELKLYKLSFIDIAENCPKHKDTRDNLLNIALACINSQTIISSLQNKKQLPIKEICLITNSKRKLIETWRKYLIALIIILYSDNYTYIKGYLNIEKAGDIND